MAEEQDNQIERREPGGINRRSETARRGSDAARFVRRLANRHTESNLSSTVSTDCTFEFSLKWGTHGEGDGQFDIPHGVAVATDGSVYVSDSGNGCIQKFTSSNFVTQFSTPNKVMPEGNKIWVLGDGLGFVFTRNRTRVKLVHGC